MKKESKSFWNVIPVPDKNIRGQAPSGIQQIILWLLLGFFLIFAAPNAEAAATANRAYVANYTAGTVSVIDTTTNTVVTDITVGTNPQGIAVNPSANRAYVTNYNSNNVSVIDTTNNTVVSTITPGGNPWGVAVNPSVNRAYVANYTASTVHVIDTTTNTVVTDITVGTNPLGIAVNSSINRAYVTNYNSQNVSVIDTTNNTVVATISVGQYPWGVAVHPSANRAYVVSSFAGTVYVIDTTNNTVVSTIAGQAMRGVAVNPATNRAYVVNYNNNNVSVIDTTTNTVVTTIAVGTNPTEVAVNPLANRAYVTNSGGSVNHISVIDTTSNTVVNNITFGIPGAGPISVAVTDTAYLLGGSIQGTPLDPAANNVSTFAGLAGTFGSADGTGTAARFNYPYDVTTDGTNLFVADIVNDTIRKIVISTGAVTTLAGLAGSIGSTDGTGSAARFNAPYGITTDGTNLFVSDTYNNTIRKIVISTGAVTTIAGTAGLSGSTDGTGSAARFSNPFGITTDGTNLFVADRVNHTIRKIVISTGVVTTIAGSAGVSGSTDATGTAASFNQPIGITTDGTNLFVGDAGNHTIRKIVISTGAVTSLAGLAGSIGSTDGTGSAARFNYPDRITTDGINLFVGDSGNHIIRKIVISTGEVTTLAGSAGVSGSTDGTGLTARFYSPWGITTDGTNLFVADSGNHTIRKISKDPLYTLTLTKSGTGAGTVTSDIGGINCGATCSGTYGSGAVVTLTASANTGSTFTGWSGGVCSGTGTCVVTMDAAKSVTATFTLNQYSLSISKSGSGTVTSSPAGINCGGTCTWSYDYGTSVTLTASPSSGYIFSGWSGGGCSGTGTCVTSILGSTSVLATFTINTYTVTPSAGSGGSISPATPQTINYGSATSFTVTPNAGYTASVGGTCGGTLTGNTYTTNAITGDCTVTAAFTLNTYTVSTSAGAGGSISPTSQSVSSGGTTSFTITANSGYSISSVTGCSGTLSGSTYTTGAITANCTVTAAFASSGYTLTISKSGAGSGTVKTTNSSSGIDCGTDCAETYTSGKWVTLRGYPSSGSIFRGWSGCNYTRNRGRVCYVNMNSNKGVTANFTR